jgi:23S rRNA pseudouridine2605 synthase
VSEDRKPDARDEARKARYEEREKERAKLDADPVYASLKPAPEQPAAPRFAPATAPEAAGMNRRQRRDAARAAGQLPELPPQGEELPKRAWRPEAADAEALASDAPQGKPGNFKPRPRDFKGKDFKPRGPKPDGFKPRGAGGGKPFGKSSGGKPFRGKPGGKPPRDRRA